MNPNTDLEDLTYMRRLPPQKTKTNKTENGTQKGRGDRKGNVGADTRELGIGQQEWGFSSDFIRGDSAAISRED